MPPDTMWPHRRKSFSMNDGSGKRLEFLAVLNRPELRTGNADTSARPLISRQRKMIARRHDHSQVNN
jgi:hypothetical protein